MSNRETPLDRARALRDARVTAEFRIKALEMAREHHPAGTAASIVTATAAEFLRFLEEGNTP